MNNDNFSSWYYTQRENSNVAECELKEITPYSPTRIIS
ncbi:hypothetical protein VAA_04192 [Vibrio anguillarum 775]|nr:hypothetical protein VAA_04192 [Vibrio anguillarum 775]